MSVKWCRLGRGGQSILEYLVVATVVIAAIMAVRVSMGAKFTAFGTNAVGSLTEAQGAVSTLVDKDNQDPRK